MHGRESKTARRGGFRVELDQHRSLLPHHPRVMAWFHHHHVRRDKFKGAAIRIRALDVAAGQEADVHMYAQRRPDERLQVRGPAEARRIDETLDTAVRCLDAVDGDAAKLLVGGACDGGKQSIHGLLPYQREGLLRQTGSTVWANTVGCQEARSSSRPEERPTLRPTYATGEGKIKHRRARAATVVRQQCPR